MTTDNFTELSEQEAKKQHISAKNYDIVSMNLQTFDAMIQIIVGEGFDRFSEMSEDARHWYLMQMSGLSQEAVTAINAK